jgi:tripartite-type tricarboxylate transporter receptor subunit TctC
MNCKLSMLFRAALLALLATGVQAQGFPTKPITLVVPFDAGGPTDTLARTVGQAMTTNLKQTILVENRGGAGGTIGVNYVAKAKNDGYTLLLHHIGMSTAPALYRTLPYKPIDDFEMIGLVADVPMTLIAKKDLPPNNFKELVAFLKANKDKTNYANAGLGAASHLCGLLFMSAIETDMTTVPYKGTAPAMTSLLGGQVDLMCDQTTNTTANIKAGKVKVYGVTTKTRVASLKDIPTLDEQGLKGFEVAVWHGVYAPKGTPKAALDRLVASLQEALRDATVKARLADLGTEPVPQAKVTPEALRAHLKAEIEKWGPIIKKAGIYAD